VAPPAALIVGAGIGGLAAGIALRRAGWHVRIFERAASPRELGFALNLAPNAMTALRELGIAEQLVDEGHIPGDVEVRHADGRLLRRVRLAALMAASQAPTVVALRSALHGALLNATEPDALILNSEAIGFEVAAAGVVLRLGDGRTAAADVLVGADGIGSIVRRLLHPREPRPRRTGYLAVRGVAHDAVRHLGGLSGVGYFGRGIEAATVRASRSAVYWYVSLLAEDVPPDPGGAHAIVDRCAAALDAGFRAIVRATTPENLRLDELFDRDPIDDWGAGPVTLLGDAAHPMLPHTGQGAAQALEDAVALGLSMASGREPIGSLRRYERVRSKRTRSVVRRGRWIAGITTTKSPIVGWLRNAAVRGVPMQAVRASLYLAGRKDPHGELR
jgi:2-polyprenyl-6-methoxyphenol hydroxylase-like FAD-dependent oxidoreductase